MPNALTSTGLTVSSQAELIAYYDAAYEAIYGSDIVLSSDSPDGQLIGILVQANIDTEDIVSTVYTGFDPDQAFGVTLDMRVAINGIQRQVGTYTTTPVTITNSQSINLYGLDQTAQQVYTVQDGAGIQWQLQTTTLGLAAESHVLEFQSANPGAIVSNPNTITVQTTPVVGVTGVNNPSTYTFLGQNEETDAALRIRRQQSVALPGQGYNEALTGALLNVTGVTYVNVVENDTNSTVAGVPAHAIWVIVGGSASAASIAQAIYVERNAGCGFYSTAPNVQSYGVLRPSGSTFTVYWSTIQTVPVYIYFQTYSLSGTAPPNLAAIQAALPTTFLPDVDATVNVNQIGALVQAADPNTLILSTGLDTGVVQIITLSGSTSGGSGGAELTYNGTATISITAANWSASNLQTKLRTATGDAALTVTGTSSTGPFTVTFVDITEPYLIGVQLNSLETSGSVAITFGFYSGFSNTLTPAAANNQFITTSADIIMLPMILAGAAGTTGIGYTYSNSQVASTTLSIAHGGNTFQFAALGGYGSPTYSISSSVSSTIGATTGLYTSGSSSGTDTITVVDLQGNKTTCVVAVT